MRRAFFSARIFACLRLSSISWVSISAELKALTLVGTGVFWAARDVADCCGDDFDGALLTAAVGLLAGGLSFGTEGDRGFTAALSLGTEGDRGFTAALHFGFSAGAVCG